MSSALMNNATTVASKPSTANLMNSRSKASMNKVAQVTKRGDRFVQKSFNDANDETTAASSSQLTSQQLALFAHHAASALNKKRGQNTVQTNSTKGKSDANIVTFAAASSSGNPAFRKPL